MTPAAEGGLRRAEPDAPRIDYRIAMGVRAGEPEWRRRINPVIRSHQKEIDAILPEYGLATVDEGTPASREARGRGDRCCGGRAGAGSTGARPDGYRMDDYRAPVPDAVPGGVVLHAEAVRATLDRHEAVLIDVLPAPRRPAWMRPEMPWIPQPHSDDSWQPMVA